MCLKDLGVGFDRWESGLRTRGYRVGEAQNSPGLQFHMRLMQFGSMCQIFMEHIRIQDRATCPQAIKDGAPVLLALSEVSSLWGH